MNIVQKIIILITIALLILSFLYPHWHHYKHPTQSLGYRFIFDPPTEKVERSLKYGYDYVQYGLIDYQRLRLQLIIIIFSGGGFVLAFKSRNKR